MVRSPRVVLSLVVAASLAVPATSFAQRAGTTGSSSSSSGSSSGSGSQGSAIPRGGDTGGGGNGNSGGGSSNSGGGGSVDRTPPPPPPPAQSRPSGRTPTSSGSSTGSKASPRSGSSGSTSRPTSGGATSRTSGGGTNGVVAGDAVDPVFGRNRNGRPVIGSAAPRPTVVGPIYAPWSYWSPIYNSGFGWNLGYVSYVPWGYYGGAGFYWGRYSPWYYPYPYGYYDPFYDPYYPYSYGSYRSDDPDYKRPAKSEQGSLRIKASPSTAKVYVDGTLMGVVDDYDGLSHHLELDPGVHRVELRADGYQTIAKDVTVTTSTTTVRFSLKKN